MANPASKSTARTPPSAATVDEGIRLAAAGRIEDAIVCFERILIFNPQNSNACNNLGVVHTQTGNIEAATAMFERALAINPLDRQIRENCIQAYSALAQVPTLKRQFSESIAPYRRLLALDPENVFARINLAEALARTGTPAEQGDFMADANMPLGNHALIACMPKSGSSLLFELLHKLTGWDKRFFAYAFMQNEQDLYLPRVREYAQFDTITQQHCRATNPNIQIIQGFGIRPVILVRNLADVVMSLQDFYDVGAVHNTFMSADWPALSQEAKRDYIIDHVMPWYVTFYASWRRAASDKAVDCLFVSYEEMIADKPGTLMVIAEFLGLEKTLDECAATIAKAEGDKFATRFNKGVAGRGKAALSDEQQARLHRLAVPYASTDFSPIGL